MARVLLHYFVICLLLCYIAIYSFTGLAMAYTVLFHGESASPSKLVVSVTATLCVFASAFFASCLLGFLKEIKGT